MAKSEHERVDPPQQQYYCRSCEQEFAGYKGEMTVKCPRCGRVSRLPLHRRRLRLAAVALLVGLVIAIILGRLLGL